MKKCITGALIWSLLILQTKCDDGVPLPLTADDSGDGSGGGGGLNTLQAVILSVGLLTGLVVCAFCTRSWWIRFYRALCGIPEPEVPVAEFDAYLHNANGRERDPVLIQPIPPIATISEGRSSFELQETNVATIVPLEDQTALTHDWFETEIGNKNINRSNVEYIATMGRGWFGNVMKAQVRHPNPFHDRLPAVVKELRDVASNREQIRFLDEARFYRDESHENVLQLLGYSIERTPYMLLFQYLPLGTLKDYLITKCMETQNQSMLIRMAIDVAKGLEWMEHAGFVHGDLAARNCLVASAAGKVVIGDYGLSTERFRNEYYWSGNSAIPIRWLAPECLHITMNTIITNRATTMSNVWTYGVVLWEIIQLGKLPYLDLTDDDVLDQVINTRTYILERPKTACIAEAVRDKLYDIMLTCWNTEPTTRPRITDLLNVLRTP